MLFVNINAYVVSRNRYRKLLRKKRSKIMAENKVAEATWNMVKSLREANDAMSDSIIAAQERNVKFAQSLFANTAEVFKSQTESTRALAEELTEQVVKQQKAFQKVVHELVDAYMEISYSPLSYYKQAFETAQSIALEGVETAQRAVNQGIEVAGTVNHHGQKTSRAAAR